MVNWLSNFVLSFSLLISCTNPPKTLCLSIARISKLCMTITLVCNLIHSSSDILSYVKMLTVNEFFLVTNSTHKLATQLLSPHVYFYDLLTLTQLPFIIHLQFLSLHLRIYNSFLTQLSFNFYNFSLPLTSCEFYNFISHNYLTSCELL